MDREDATYEDGHPRNREIREREEEEASRKSSKASVEVSGELRDRLSIRAKGILRLCDLRGKGKPVMRRITKQCLEQSNTARAEPHTRQSAVTRYMRSY